MRTVSIVVCTIVLALTEIDGQLSVGTVSCGQLSCKNLEYCSDIDRTCQPCSKICEQSNHNFEANLCKRSCQDYIHDQRYIRKQKGDDEDLRQTVEKLSNLVTVSLTLICFILIILATVLGIQVMRWMKKKNVTLATFKQAVFSKAPRENDTKSNNASQPNKKPDLRLEISPSEALSDHSPVTMTTSITRRPAEDSTLDYAYDNPAMTNTSNASQKY